MNKGCSIVMHRLRKYYANVRELLDLKGNFFHKEILCSLQIKHNKEQGLSPDSQNKVELMRPCL